ncbi:tetratricopeptide repeat protein, partial [Acetobacter lovaniensis]|uniref:tetratricopeptide repeat protein n=1 Tax=Acetobacter lovaniensis TaxID=104100 RepID=UPI00376FDDE5
MLYEKKGRVADALAEYGIAIEREQGQEADTLLLRGRLHARREQWREAAKDFRKAADLKPIDPEIIHQTLLVAERATPPG